MKKINKKLDGILAPEEVTGTFNLTHEQELAIAFGILVFIGLLALVLS